MEDASSGLELKCPDFTKRFVNIHYQSESSGEFGTIIIRHHTTEDDVLNQYGRLFPIEARQALSVIRELNQSLFFPGGMSEVGIMGAITKIPEILYMAMKYFDIDYWSNKRNLYRFVRRYPKFMVGDHRAKDTKGVIVK